MINASAELTLNLDRPLTSLLISKSVQTPRHFRCVHAIRAFKQSGFSDSGSNIFKRSVVSFEISVAIYQLFTKQVKRQYFNQSSRMSAINLLLKNGTALLHSEGDKVEARRTNILVSGSTIKLIAPNIAAPPGTEVINCTGMNVKAADAHVCTKRYY